MTPEFAVMIAVVAAIGFPAAFWNRTSGALVAAWSIGALYAWWTGDEIPTKLYVVTDGFVLGVIFSKSPYRKPFLTWLRQSWIEKSSWDRAIVLIFVPTMWTLYALPMEEYHRYWALYYLAIAQFLAAAGESLAYLLSRGRSRSDTPPPGLYRMAWARSGGT